MRHEIIERWKTVKNNTVAKLIWIEQIAAKAAASIKEECGQVVYGELFKIKTTGNYLPCPITLERNGRIQASVGGMGFLCSDSEREKMPGKHWNHTLVHNEAYYDNIEILTAQDVEFAVLELLNQ